MTEFLIRRFIPNWQNTDDPAIREKYGTLAATVGIVSNLFLFLMKLLAGLFSASVAIIADAINNLSDAGSSIITFFAFKFAGKPADSRHPYGHARIEYISGMAVSIIIIVLGLELLGSSFDKIIHPEDITISALTYAALLLSIAIKLWQGLFNRSLSKKISSEALAATAADSLNDAFSTSAVLVSTVIFHLTNIPLDGWIGILVSILITISGIKLVTETADLLIGKAPDPETVKNIRDRILSHEGIVGMHDLQVHNYGPGRLFASVHAEVPAEEDILTSHDIIDNVERQIMEEMGVHLVIHMDPVITGDPELDRLREKTLSVIRKIDPKIGIHDFRAVFGTTHTNLLFDVLVPMEFAMTDKDLSDLIQSRMRQQGNYFCVITVDHDYACGEQS